MAEAPAAAMSSGENLPSRSVPSDERDEYPDGVGCELSYEYSDEYDPGVGGGRLRAVDGRDEVAEERLGL